MEQTPGGHQTLSMHEHNYIHPALSPPSNWCRGCLAAQQGAFTWASEAGFCLMLS